MKKLRELLEDNAAFTLIELLVVIAVLGILAGIAVPRLTGVTDRAKKSEAVSALGSIKTALEIEELESDSYSTSIGAIADQYLENASGSGISATWEDWTIQWATDGSPDGSGNFTVEMVKDTDDDGTNDLTVHLDHSSNGYEIIENP